jgi:hypothetical protein
MLPASQPLSKRANPQGVQGSDMAFTCETWQQATYGWSPRGRHRHYKGPVALYIPLVSQLVSLLLSSCFLTTELVSLFPVFQNEDCFYTSYSLGADMPGELYADLPLYGERRLTYDSIRCGKT